MKNTAILIVQYDSVSKKYETDLTYLSNHDKKDNELYISSSPKVSTELIKFATNKTEVKELQDLEQLYRNKNYNGQV